MHTIYRMQAIQLFKSIIQALFRHLQKFQTLNAFIITPQLLQIQFGKIKFTEVVYIQSNQCIFQQTVHIDFDWSISNITEGLLE